MICQHCNRRYATWHVSATEASPAYVVCSTCVDSTSEFATLRPLHNPNDRPGMLDVRRWAFYSLNARMVDRDTGMIHGPGRDGSPYPRPLL